MKTILKSILVLALSWPFFDLFGQTEIQDDRILMSEGLGVIFLDRLPNAPHLEIKNISSFFTANPLDPKGGIIYNSLFHNFEIFDNEVLSISEDDLALHNLEVHRDQSGSNDLLPYAYAAFRRNGGVNLITNSTGNLSFSNVTGGVEVALSTAFVAENMIISVTPIIVGITAPSQCAIEYLTGANDHKFIVRLYSSSGSTVSNDYGINVVVHKP